MQEFDFIKLLKPASVPLPEGIGDDAAVMGDLLIATDIMAESTHFFHGDPPESILQHLFVSNISDIAAMGGKKGGYKALLGVSVGEYYNKRALAKAITKLCKRYDVAIIGGDTVTGATFFSMTIIGRKNDRVLTRAGAREGDIVFVSRLLGESGYALQCKFRNKTYNYQFKAEARLGELLGSIDGVTACLDISDGLGIDLSHIASLSGVKIVLEYDKIPIADIDIFEDEKLEFAISSGEEYCLAFTVAAEQADAVQAIVKQKLNRKIYRIGVVESGSGCWLRSPDGTEDDISQMGYEHR